MDSKRSNLFSMVEVTFEIDERNQFKIPRQYSNFSRTDQFNIKTNLV